MAKKNLLDRKDLTKSRYTGIIAKDKYVSVIDYDIFEISSEEKDKLIELEKIALDNAKKINDHLFSLGEIFYNAQKLLSHCNKGTFLVWIDKLGFKKTFVYEVLDKYNLYLKYNNNKVFELSNRSVREVKKLDEEKALEVIVAEKPLEKLKEIKATIVNEIEEAVIVEDPVEQRLRIINNRIKELEIEMEELLKERNRLERNRTK